MNISKAISNLVKDPSALARPAVPSGLSTLGMTGYILGTIALFAYLRLQSSVMPSFFAFIGLLLIILFSEILDAGVLHALLNFAGYKGNAATTFYLFGISFACSVLYVPIGLLLIFNPFWGSIALLLMILLIFGIRIKFVKMVYPPISTGKSILYLSLPSAMVLFFIYFSLLYWLANIIWAAYRR